MKRANRILASLRLVESFVLTRSSPARSLHIQVIHYSHLSLLTFPSSLQNQDHNSNFANTHQRFYFSSKPNSIVELITTNEWSQDLEQELEKLNPIKITHEPVVYVLKKLDKTPLKALDFFNWVSDKHGFKHNSMHYSLMLRILAGRETIKEFWALCKKMSEEGCKVGEETYLTILTNLKSLTLISDANAWTQFVNKMKEASATDAIVNSVVDVVMGLEGAADVKEKLGELNVVLSENTILEIFKALVRHPFKALCVFRWVEEHTSYKHGAVTYNSILRLLGQETSIEEFWDMVKEMKEKDHDVDFDTYIKLSRQFQRNRMMKDAVALYELMMDSPYKPLIRECNSLLRQIASTETPDLNLVFRVVKRYEAAGHTLSKAVYDGIHRSLTSVGKFKEAEDIIGTMRNAGYEPDNITYSQVVFGLCKAGKLEEACKMLDDMEEEGCVPDIKTWTILIQGHCNDGEIDQALKLFTKLLEKNLDADADLLDIMVNGLFRKGRVDSAYTLVTEMVDKGDVRPWQATYKHLIEKLLGERKLEEAMKLLYLMKKHSFPPYPEPFVGYISKFGTIYDAKEFLKVLSIKQYPSSAAYLNVIKSFIKESRQSEARDLFYMCPHHIRNHSDILKLFAEPTPTKTAA